MEYAQREEYLWGKIYEKTEMYGQISDNAMFDSLEEYYSVSKAYYTEEEQKLINKRIEECNERYKKTGNRLYTHEEVWKSIYDKYYTEEEIQGENVEEYSYRQV